jgi:hypothetical protein
MTKLLVTTVRRHTPNGEPSGHLYAVDLKKREVLRKIPMVEPRHRALDPNARGGLRGGKGMFCLNDELLMANFDTIFRYDPKWQLKGAISHPSCAAIHDLIVHDNLVWVTSARNDSVVAFDLQGKLQRVHYLREPSPALRAMGWKPPRLLTTQGLMDGTIDFRDPRTHEHTLYDAAHINSICALANGDLLVSLGIIWGRMTTLFHARTVLRKIGVWSVLMGANRLARQTLGLGKRMHTDLVVQPVTARSVVVRIDQQGTVSLCLQLKGVAVPSHSLRPQPDGTVLYMNTNGGEVVQFEPQSGKVLHATKVTDGFLRGATELDEHKIVCGSKGELLVFDAPSRRVLDSFTYSRDTHESVFDIRVLPAHFALPPEQLPEPCRALAESHLPRRAA